MRKMMSLVSIAWLVVAFAAPAGAAPTVHLVSGRLVDTHLFGIPASEVALVPGDDPGTNWLGDGLWHVRSVPVTDTFETLDGLIVMGHLERSVSFELDLTTGASRARCAFSVTLTEPDLGAFRGRCSGTLLEGKVVANGPTGHVQGTYVLESGGTAGVGPYLLELEIREG